jgi:hypothetical protein
VALGLTKRAGPGLMAVAPALTSGQFSVSWLGRRCVLRSAGHFFVRVFPCRMGTSDPHDVPAGGPPGAAAPRVPRAVGGVLIGDQGVDLIRRPGSSPSVPVAIGPRHPT